MKTAYNLSYNNQAIIEKLLSDISFNTKEEAGDFAIWFNRVVKTNQFISLSDICDRLWIDIPEGKNEVFDMVGFNSPMYCEDAMFSTYKDGWIIAFPWFIDSKYIRKAGDKS